MGFKGGPKTGGRGKGTPNKDSVPAEQKARELGIDPFEVLLRFADGDWKALGYESDKVTAGITANGTRWEKYTIDPAVRQKAAAEACSYIFPKRKAIDHTASGAAALAAMSLTQLFASVGKQNNAGDRSDAANADAGRNPGDSGSVQD